MNSDDHSKLGDVIKNLGKVTVHQHGVIAAGWTGTAVMAWDSVKAVNFDARKETLTLVLVPVFSTESRTLVLEDYDGKKLTVRGTHAEEVYTHAVLATRERILTTSVNEIRAGKPVSFGVVTITKDGLEKPVKLSWTAIKSLNVKDGLIEAERFGKGKDHSLIEWLVTPDNILKSMCRTSAVGNLEVFLEIYENLRRDARNIPAEGGKPCGKCSKGTRLHARFCPSCFYQFGPDDYPTDALAMKRLMHEFALERMSSDPVATNFPIPEPKNNRWLQLQHQLQPNRRLWSLWLAGDVGIEGIHISPLINSAPPEEFEQFQRKVLAILAEAPSTPAATAPVPRTQVPSLAPTQVHSFEVRYSSRAAVDNLKKKLARFKTYIDTARIGPDGDEFVLKLTTKPISVEVLFHLQTALKN